MNMDGMTQRSDSFLESYLAYAGSGEVPVFFNRWASIVGLGAYLGRHIYFNHGHFTVNPNIYCMLIGSPGTRKSTAIKLMKGVMQGAGYNTIAADKTTKEKFMLDLSGADQGDAEVLEQNLWGAEAEDAPPAEMLIAADEFNDFMGVGNLEFISLLGSLWDYSGIYRNRIKNGKSVSIKDPTISILGGNTPTGFSLAFPTDILGQGFFSRLILVYGEPNGKRITFPRAPAAAEVNRIVGLLRQTKLSFGGAVPLGGTAEKLLDKIYKQWTGVGDVRFESYSNRRFTHLLKLCIISAASRFGDSIDEGDVIYANTVLSYTEHLMPKALGEFGKSKNSDVSHKIMQVLENALAPVLVKELWKSVHTDLEKLTDLTAIVQNLLFANKVQRVGNGFLAVRKVAPEGSSDTYNYEMLTEEERGYIT
jgi:energy-coupling factor transporter ATP-binding protein EcfA2